jgi:hypothetical protein
MRAAAIVEIDQAAASRGRPRDNEQEFEVVAGTRSPTPDGGKI